MPKPLLYLQLDANYEHVLKAAREKYPQKDAIKHVKYFADPRGDLRANNAAIFEGVFHTRVRDKVRREVTHDVKYGRPAWESPVGK